jgi:hypothetical protein
VTVWIRWGERKGRRVVERYCPWEWRRRKKKRQQQAALIETRK